jgi:putative flippase GtrA
MNDTENETPSENGAETAKDIKEKKSSKETFIQFLKFTAFSLGAGIIELVSFTLLNELTGLDYWASYFIALVLSVLYNFTVNRRFTFKSAANIPLAMLMVFLFYCAFTPYSIWLTDFLDVRHDWNEYLVLLIVMVQNLILEFLWCRFVVYRKNINTAAKK